MRRLQTSWRWTGGVVPPGWRSALAWQWDRGVAILAVMGDVRAEVEGQKRALWRRLDVEGHEYLVLHTAPTGRTAEGLCISSEEGEPLGLRYRVRLAPGGSVLEAEIVVPGGPRLSVRSDGRGTWWDAAGARLAALDGSLELDISASAFTNSLVIWRLGLRAGQSQTLRMAYVEVPALSLSAVEQRYTCLEEGRQYRYEGHPPGYSAELTVDVDGLVVDYPGLFRRVG